MSVCSCAHRIGRLLRWIEEHFGAATNMKRTLVRSPASLRALMIATNVFNNALRVDLDESLQPYLAPGPRRRG